MHDRRHARPTAGRALRGNPVRVRRWIPVRPWLPVTLVTLATLVALVGVAACGRAAPPPVTTTATPAPSSATVTTPTASGATSGSTATGTSTTVPTATALPTGTAVPFRTVQPGSAAGRRIGVIGPSTADPFSSAVVGSVVEQLTTAGATVARCDPGQDASLVLDCARRFSTQQVDGWIVIQSGNLGDALCAAGPQQVPLITVGTAPLPCETGWVGADDRGAGALAGSALGRSAAAGGHCSDATLVIITDTTEDPVSATRAAGIRDGFAEQCPGRTAEPTVVDAGTQDRGLAAVRAALDATPADGRMLIAAVNDSAAMGVAAAVPQDRIDRVALAAVGGDLRARCSMAKTDFWIGDAALFPDRYGEVVVPALLDALQGRPVPPAMYIVPTLLTAGPAATYYPHDDCPDS